MTGRRGTHAAVLLTSVLTASFACVRSGPMALDIRPGTGAKASEIKDAMDEITVLSGEIILMVDSLERSDDQGPQAIAKLEASRAVTASKMRGRLDSLRDVWGWEWKPLYAALSDFDGLRVNSSTDGDSLTRLARRLVRLSDSVSRSAGRQSPLLSKYSLLESVVINEVGRTLTGADDVRRLFPDTSEDAEAAEAIDGSSRARYSVRRDSDIVVGLMPTERFRGRVTMRARILRETPVELPILNFSTVSSTQLATESAVFVPDDEPLGRQANALRRDLHDLCVAIDSGSGLAERGRLAGLPDRIFSVTASVARLAPDPDQKTAVRASTKRLESIARDWVRKLATCGGRSQPECPDLDTAPEDYQYICNLPVVLDRLEDVTRTIYISRLKEGRISLASTDVKHGDVVELYLHSRLPKVDDGLLSGSTSTSTDTFSYRFYFRVYEDIRVQAGGHAALVARLSDVARPTAAESPSRFKPAPGGVLSLRFGGRAEWVDWLIPSVGFYAFLVDFDPAATFELGLAGGVGLVNSSVHLGFGANAMAERNSAFFFLSLDFLRAVDAFGVMFPSQTKEMGR